MTDSMPLGIVFADEGRRRTASSLILLCLPFAIHPLTVCSGTRAVQVRLLLDLDRDIFPLAATAIAGAMNEI